MSGFCCPRCGIVSHNPADIEHGYCGNCHAFTGVTEGALRFRLYVERRIAAEAWVTLDAGFEERAAKVGDEQNVLARQADEAGQLWHVEVFDPALPCDFAYARMGTDKGAMILPIEITPPREGT